MAIPPDGDLTASIDDHEIRDVLFSDYDAGIFGGSPNLSGVLFFEELKGLYQFEYFPNPKPLMAITLPSGLF